jgi:hypothetical protein
MCCGFDSTLSTILVSSWKCHFKLKKTFYSWKWRFQLQNVIETIVENPDFSLNDFTIKPLPLNNFLNFYARLPPCSCICHDTTNTFVWKCSLTSCQYKVNLGQNEVGLPKIQLHATKNLIIQYLKPFSDSNNFQWPHFCDN